MAHVSEGVSTGQSRSDWALQPLAPCSLYGCQETCPEILYGEFPQQGFLCRFPHVNGKFPVLEQALSAGVELGRIIGEKPAYAMLDG